jgi:hypothetical protein
MIYVLAVLAGIAAAVAGWFITGVVAGAVAGLFGMSDFEGGRGMFAFLFAGPLGGLAAMLAAIWAVLGHGAGAASRLGRVGRLGAVLAAIALLVAGGIALRLWRIDTYTDALPPALEFEIRFPPGIALEQRDAVRVELHTDRNTAESAARQWSRAADGSDVLRGVVSLDFKTSSRLLVVAVPDQPTRLFALPLARDPDATAAFSAWVGANHLDDAAEAQPRPAPADDPMAMRYRVRRTDQ